MYRQLGPLTIQGTLRTSYRIQPAYFNIRLSFETWRVSAGVYLAFHRTEVGIDFIFPRYS